MTQRTTMTPENFVPNDVFGYFGPVCAHAPGAAIKRKPDEFNVAEQPHKFPLCTTSTATDLAGFSLDSSLQKLQMTAVTAVKSRMTTYAVRKGIADELGIRLDQVTYAGLKDAMHTAQLMVITGVPFEKVARACMPKPLGMHSSWFIKDPRPVDFTLKKGYLKGNYFTIKVHCPGMSQADIEQYLEPIIEHLAEHKNLFPNAYGRQRLGRRQNLLAIGIDFLSDPQAAIKRYLTETSPNEQAEVTAIRESLADSWRKAEEAAQAGNGKVADQHFHFDAMRCDLERLVKKGGSLRQAQEAYNLTIEYQIVCSTLRYMDFNLVMADLKDEFSLWVGSYQSFWFNQVLAQVIRGETKLGYQGKNPDPKKASRRDIAGIPLLTGDAQSMGFYNTHCREAIPERVDDVVRRLFLSTSHTVVDVEVKPSATQDETNRALARMLHVRVGQIVDLTESSSGGGIVGMNRDSHNGACQRKLILDLPHEVYCIRAWGKNNSWTSSCKTVTIDRAAGISFDVVESKRGSRVFTAQNLRFPDVKPEVRDQVVERIRNLASAGRLRVNRGPWRKSFVPISEFTYEVEEEAVTMQFLLPSGAYATTILGILFNLDGDDRETEEERD